MAMGVEVEPNLRRNLCALCKNFLSPRPKACLDEGGDGEECERGSLKTVGGSKANK